MSDFNFVTDARLAAGSYSSNNQNNTQVIDGWKPLQLLSSTGEPISEGTFSQTFGAQLYEKGGQYKVVFRGTEGNVSDWVQNLKYGTFQWSDEFRDAVAFMAKAVKNVADEKFRGDVRKAASYFTTTGHSQGGFQAELAALMFGVKGTSLDGMGAMGVAQQFRAELNKVMEENGVSDLIRTDEKLSLNSTDFQTRIYTAVGRLGVHAGETDGAWSWTATKMMLIFNPALAGIAVGGGLVAHPISSIVANEEKRVSSPLWKLIGDASDTTDPFNTPTQLASQIIANWGSIQLAHAGADLAASLGALPDAATTDHIRNQIDAFLAANAGQSYDEQVLGKNIFLRMQNGDGMMIFSNGEVYTGTTLGSTLTEHIYDTEGKIKYLRRISPDANGNTVVREESPAYQASMTLNANREVITARSEQYESGALKTCVVYSTQTIDGKTHQVTETTHHLARGGELATLKELISADGIKIVNTQTADGHLEESTYTINPETGQTEAQSHKVLSYSEQERSIAASDVALAGLELLQALRANNKLQAAASLIRLTNSAEIASNKMPTLGAVGTGFSGAVSVLSALDAWGDASDGQRIALTARTILGANEIAKAFSVDGKTGFLESSAVLGGLQGVVAIAGLKDTIQSGNPFAIASSFMTIANSAVAVVTSNTAGAALGVKAFSDAALFGPQTMIAVAICSIIFGSIFGEEIEYPEPPPAGQAHVGTLADGSMGILIQDGNGKLIEERHLNGQILQTHYAQEGYGYAEDGSEFAIYITTYQERNWGMGAEILSQRLSTALAQMQTQAEQNGMHLILERLPSLQIHAHPSFDRNGADNFFFSLQLQNPLTGAQEITAFAPQDLIQQYQQIAHYAGAWADATEWAQIQSKQAAGLADALQTEGQYLDTLSGPEPGDSLRSLAQAKAQQAANQQNYTLLTLDLENNGISLRAKPQAGMSLEQIQADTSQGITRLDADNDGYLELTQWVGSKEAILAIDRNNDGIINQASELLSGAELSTSAQNRIIQRLAYFDANGDGLLNRLDPYFAQFKLWVDINGDARSGVGELHSLSAAGINRIQLQSGTVVFDDGQSLQIQQTQLSADVRGVKVEAISDGQGGVMPGQFLVQQEGEEAQTHLTADAASDLSEILNLVKPYASISADEQTRLTALAQKYGIDLSNPAALLGLGGGGNMAGSPTQTTATTADIFTINQAPDAEEVKAALRAFFTQWVMNPESGPALNHHVLQAQEDTQLRIKTADLLAGLAGVSLVSLQDARRGTITQEANGDIIFTPLNNQFGTAYFTYTAQDAAGKTSTAMVWVNIAEVNDAPVALNDTFSVQEDQTLTLALSQLLANDTDADIATDANETLTLTAVNNASHGNVALVNGQVVFQAQANYQGTARFEYTVRDSQGATATATASVEVVGQNDAPVLSTVARTLQARPSQATEDTALRITSTQSIVDIGSDVDILTNGQTLALTAMNDAPTPQANTFQLRQAA